MDIERIAAALAAAWNDADSDAWAAAFTEDADLADRNPPGWREPSVRR